MKKLPAPHKTRIVHVHITKKALAQGVTVFDIFRLVIALQVEYYAYNPLLPEPHVCVPNDPLAISGIFDVEDWQAKVCICLPSELELGEPDELGGRQLLYPRNAPIAGTISLAKLTNHFIPASKALAKMRTSNSSQ